MASFPRIFEVLGVVSAIYFRLSDPRRKEDILLDQKKKILSGAMTEKDSLRLAAIDEELLKVRREISRVAR